jgi:retron-type reverse transcriptase
MSLLSGLSKLFGKRQRTVAELARWLDTPEKELREWLTSSPAWARGYDYSRFTIPKRRGGSRTIDAPGENLKALQRKILHKLLNPLSPHPAATGFVPGHSIVDNARPHVGRGVVINLDLADFFPSVAARHVEQIFRAMNWDAEAATILARICTLDGRLPQGAPTSPALSNLVCRRLDARLSALAEHFNGHYTRYADDLTFSGDTLVPKGQKDPKSVAWLLARARHVVEDEGFEVNEKKVRVQRRNTAQVVTGIVVNDKASTPRAERRRLRAVLHRARFEGLEKQDRDGRPGFVARLRGQVAYVSMVNAEQGAKLKVRLDARLGTRS